MKELLLGLILMVFAPFQSLLKTTIILINGEPHLVVIDDLGYLVETIQTVPYYFSSSLSHEQIVQGLSEQLKDEKSTFYASNEDRFVSKDEIDVAENAEFIKFLPSKALLNREAVNRIRAIAQDYLDGGIDQITLSIVYDDTSISQKLTDNRVNSVRDLMIAFGISGEDVLMQKDLRIGLNNNPFVRVSYKKVY